MSNGVQKNQTDERNAERYALNKATRVRLASDPEGVIDAFATDISSTGIGAFVPEELPAKSQIEVALPTGREEETWVPASVTRCESTVGDMFMLGVQFAEPLAKDVLSRLGLTRSRCLRRRWARPLRVGQLASAAVALVLATLWITSRLQKDRLETVTSTQAAPPSTASDQAGLETADRTAPATPVGESRTGPAGQDVAPSGALENHEQFLAGQEQQALEVRKAIEEKDKETALLEQALTEARNQHERAVSERAKAQEQLGILRQRSEDLSQEVAELAQSIQQKDKLIAELLTPPNPQQIRPNTTMALAGLDKLHLVAQVSNLRAPNAPNPLVGPDDLTRWCREILTARTNLAVTDADPQPSSEAVGALHVHLHLLSSGGAQAYNLALYVRRACALVERRSVIVADVWRLDYAGLEDADGPLNLRSSLKHLVERFVQDYTAANAPAEAQAEAALTATN